jgi:hypothetical protein
MLFAKTLITYLLNADYTLVKDPMSRIQSPTSDHWNIPSFQAFHNLAISSWDRCALRIEEQGGDDEINDLVLQLLDPYRPDFRKFHKHCARSDKNDYFPVWEVSEESCSSAILSYTCSVGLIEAAKTLLKRYDTLSVTHHGVKERPALYNTYRKIDKFLVGTPFDIAIELCREDFVSLFLRQGRVDPKSRNYLCYSVLGSIVSSKMSVDFVCECLRILIKNGADPNKSDVSLTPLQLAVFEVCMDRSGINVVELLLDFGADVNAVGDDAAAIKYLELKCGDEFGYYYDIDNRGLNEAFKFYDTPLRIVKKEYRWNAGGDKISTLVELLKRHGAMSLHLFPVPNLPGYVAEDFESLKTHREESFTGVVMEDTSSSTLVESLVVLPCPSMFTMDLDSEDRSRGYTQGGERPSDTSLTHRSKRRKMTSTSI